MKLDFSTVRLSKVLSLDAALGPDREHFAAPSHGGATVSLGLPGYHLILSITLKNKAVNDVKLGHQKATLHHAH